MEMPPADDSRRSGITVRTRDGDYDLKGFVPGPFGLEVELTPTASRAQIPGKTYRITLAMLGAMRRTGDAEVLATRGCRWQRGSTDPSAAPLKCGPAHG